MSISQRVALRFAMDVSTPAKAGDVLRSALAPHYAHGYFRVEAERGVRVTVGRMDPELFVRKQLSEGYEEAGLNPIARINIGPGFGNVAWADLEVRADKNANEDLKKAGVAPFRARSHATPEMAVKLVIDWCLKNQAKLLASG